MYINSDIIPMLNQFDQMVDSQSHVMQDEVDEIERMAFNVFSKHLKIHQQTLVSLDKSFVALEPQYQMIDNNQSIDPKSTS